MLRTHTLDIDSPSLSFSSGHFTIFDAQHRENLHGHDYQLGVSIETQVGDDGISFDYRDIKNIFKSLCDELNSKTILPANNPYLIVETAGMQTTVTYADEILTFLPRDVLILDIRNTTLEELSHWFLMQFVEQHGELIARSQIQSLTVRLSTRPGQTGHSSWVK